MLKRMVDLLEFWTLKTKSENHFCVKNANFVCHNSHAITCISSSVTFIKWDPSAVLAEFWGLMYRFFSKIVWENVGLKSKMSKKIFLNVRFSSKDLYIRVNELICYLLVVNPWTSFPMGASSYFKEKGAIHFILFCAKYTGQIVGHCELFWLKIRKVFFASSSTTKLDISNNFLSSEIKNKSIIISSLLVRSNKNIY